VLFYVRLLVPPEYRPPHGRHPSNIGYDVSPVSVGEELRALIAESPAHFLVLQRNQPAWAPNSPEWPVVF
jgi:hypothetical protein